MTWRLIQDDAVTASFGLAADEATTQRVGEGLSTPTLRLYSYQPCALVGRFQTLSHELNLDYCMAQDIPVNRRPTGGGGHCYGARSVGGCVDATVVRR